MRQVSSQQSLAKLEFVGATVGGNGEQSVDVVLGESGLECGPKAERS